jgi:sec-independent protein translocase protein TatA
MIGDILQPTHLLFILVVALLVLGPKRLPEAGRALGKGIRDFRSAISGEEDHHSAIGETTAQPSAGFNAAPTATPPAPPAPPATEFPPATPTAPEAPAAHAPPVATEHPPAPTAEAHAAEAPTAEAPTPEAGTAHTAPPADEPAEAPAETAHPVG